jgi:hypothetical protein
MAKNTGDLTPCMAECCVIASLYTDMPDCIGGAGKYVLTCFDVEYKVCKTGTSAEVSFIYGLTNIITTK